MPKDVVRNQLGDPWDAYREKGYDVWNYPGKEGSANLVVFKSNRVVKIRTLKASQEKEKEEKGPKSYFAFDLGDSFFGNTGVGGAGILFLATGIGSEQYGFRLGIILKATFDFETLEVGTEEIERTSAMLGLGLEIAYYPFSSGVTPFVSIDGGFAFARHAVAEVWYLGPQLGASAGISVRLQRRARLNIGARGSTLVDTGFQDTSPRYLAVFLGFSISY